MAYHRGEDPTASAPYCGGMEPELSRPSIAGVDHDRFDLVSIGETMVAFVSSGHPTHYRAVAAGAESNVAAGMARLGCRTRWVSRLGDDPLGRFVEESVASSGVDIDVVRDADRPTGVMTIHLTGTERQATYHRRESAASRLSVADLGRIGRSRRTHVTGITAALSPSAAELVQAIVGRRIDPDHRVSFDVNHRPVLWPDTETASRVLLGLARQADVVFVGDDEAKTLFGTADGAKLAELILRRPDQELVLKRGAGRASVITGESEASEPALSAAMVDPTGAGDAFAAGYLAAAVRGWPAVARLRLGHLMGSRVLGVIDHVVPPFSDAERESLSPSMLARLWDQHPGT